MSEPDGKIVIIDSVPARPLYTAAQVEELRAEIARLKEALRGVREGLEFYARVGVPAGCTPTGDWGPDSITKDPYWQDQGKRARDSLARADALLGSEHKQNTKPPTPGEPIPEAERLSMPEMMERAEKE